MTRLLFAIVAVVFAASPAASKTPFYESVNELGGHCKRASDLLMKTEAERDTLSETATKEQLLNIGADVGICTAYLMGIAKVLALSARDEKLRKCLSNAKKDAAHLVKAFATRYRRYEDSTRGKAFIAIFQEQPETFVSVVIPDLYGCSSD